MNIFAQAFEAIASSSGAYKCKTDFKFDLKVVGRMHGELLQEHEWSQSWVRFLELVTEVCKAHPRILIEGKLDCWNSVKRAETKPRRLDSKMGCWPFQEDQLKDIWDHVEGARTCSRRLVDVNFLGCSGQGNGEVMDFPRRPVECY